MRMPRHAFVILVALGLACQGQPDAAKKPETKTDVKAPEAKTDAAPPTAEAKTDAAPPAGELEKATVVGAGLTTEQLRPVVRDNIEGIRACYNEGLSKDPELKGKISVAFKIDAEGKVKDAGVKETTFDEALSACIVKVIGGLTFPRPSDGKEVEVVYPFWMEPG